MQQINQIEQLFLNFKWIESAEAESLENFSNKTLNRFGLAKYKAVLEPTLYHLFKSTSRESLTTKFFDVITKIQSKLPNYLDTLLNTQPNVTTIGVAGYFDKDIEGTVGGFFIPAFQKIFIDPLIFEFGSTNEIAEIIIHESYHAGAFTNGVMQMDESMTQTMTLEIMHEAGYSVEFNAYKSIVQELAEIRDGKNEYFTWDELSELYASFDVTDYSIQAAEKQDKFFDFLAMMASREIYEDGISLFEPKIFEKNIQKLVTKFLRLFPRLAKYISPDGSFIPQSEKEVSVIRFDDIFRAKISDAIVRRIESNEILAMEIESKLKSDVEVEHTRLLESELDYDPQTEEGKLQLRKELTGIVLYKYAYIPKNFPINIQEVVDNFLRGYNFEHILN